jgi:hypothetical protein
MARYKVLKGVAHNIGHSFTSLMYYAGDDYVMGHILRFARRTGRNTLTIDFVKEEGGPPELLSEPISDLPARYTKWFWYLIERHGSDRSYVRGATLILRYDIASSVRCGAMHSSRKVLTPVMFASQTQEGWTT